jgi:hypothetical protein
MSGQLIPPPELSPANSTRLSMPERVAAWFELMEASEQFLLAGVRHRIGPDGDLHGAMRRWYRQEMEQHDKKLIHLLRQLGRRERNHSNGQ